jgi:hypothetical protein
MYNNSYIGDALDYLGAFKIVVRGDTFIIDSIV